jgi:hypothetical protein
MQPASQDPGYLYGLYLLFVGICFLVICIFYIFCRDASRREHLKSWMIIFIGLFFGGAIGGTPRSKIARKETDHEAPQAEVDPVAGTKDRRS